MASSASQQVDVNLTPLLDLVLQLIMFFMITIRLVHYEVSNEEIDLPHAQLSTPMEEEKTKNKFPVWINLDYKGRIIGLGDKVIEIPIKETYKKTFKHLPAEDMIAKYEADVKKVKQQIKSYFEEKREDIRRPARLMGLKDKDYKVGVVIRADRRCRYLHVWTVMEIVQGEADYDFWQVSYLNVSG